MRKVSFAVAIPLTLAGGAADFTPCRAQDVAKGKALFEQRVACHSF